MTKNSHPLIAPHGGALVDRTVPPPQLPDARSAAASLPAIEISARAASDLLLLATGAYSPLEGFMNFDAARAVVKDLRLPGGLVWSLPILLQTNPADAKDFSIGSKVALRFRENLLGTIRVEERFLIPLRDWAQQIFRTDEEAHPGVAGFLGGGEAALAGPVEWFGEPAALSLDEDWHTPAQTRDAIARRGWQTVAGFQTRNPIHRAHEYVLRTALEVNDGLLLHPLVGETRADDLPADLRKRCYRALLDHYLPLERVQFSVLPAWMRYAGPREAVFHAVVRKNFGCTHFLVGRDHAGVGHYYGPYDAHQLLRSLADDTLGITPLYFDEVFYCRRCRSMASGRTCAHPPEARLALSGTEVRQRLRDGLPLPEEFTRPEVAAILAEAFRDAGERAHA